MLFGVKHSNTMVNLRLFLCITAFSIFFSFFLSHGLHCVLTLVVGLVFSYGLDK